ncbi:MAG: SDR family oxidoreductase [Chryseobacterium sp.]|nr:MAG: SDR family oxidoreductase [Chryseobacterium sp.]
MNKDFDKHRQRAEQTAEKYRKIQQETNEREKKSAEEKKQNDAVQAGKREQPEPPYPDTQLDKPGKEADLDLQPKYKAPDYKGSDKLKDKVAIITGADSGIGRAVAILFAREGADVAIVYLSEHEDAEQTKKDVEAEGRKAVTYSGDVSDPDFCNDVVEQVVNDFGKVDVLVNNAAFQEHAEKLEDITDEHFDTTLKTNLYGYFHMARAVLPHMKEGSSIINTSSVTGLFGSEKLLDYSLTKGGINAFTKALAKNLVDKGIRVNAVAPGPVWTPLNPADRQPDEIKEFGAQSPMKRAAQPEELSPAYVFLASPVCSSYVSGQIIGVIGGVTSD